MAANRAAQQGTEAKWGEVVTNNQLGKPQNQMEVIGSAENSRCGHLLCQLALLLNDAKAPVVPCAAVCEPLFIR